MKLFRRHHQIICVRCGLVIDEQDYENEARNASVRRFDPAVDCSHLFFDKSDRIGISIGRHAVRQGRA